MQLHFARLFNVIGALVTSSLHFASTTEYNLDLEFAVMYFQIGFSPDRTKYPSIPSILCSRMSFQPTFSCPSTWQT